MSSSYKEKVVDYINEVLDQKRPEFNNIATCPFAAPELANDKLMIAMLGEDDKGLKELLEEFQQSDYDSTLICFPHDMDADGTKVIQALVNKILKRLGMNEYKTICFNPNDKVEVEGFNPRSKAPCFMINVAHKKVLNDAHKSLRKTKYYDKINKEYREFLKINEENKTPHPGKAKEEQESSSGKT